MFQFHNETINIWTHFTGLIVALVFIGIVAFTQIGEDSPVDFLHNGLHDVSTFFFEDDPNDLGYFGSQRVELLLVLSQLEDWSGRPIHEKWFQAEFKNAEKVSKWPIIAYLLTACACFSLSTTCHLCYVHSEEISSWVSMLDYWGIASLFLGSAYPFISYKYACGHFIMWRYIFTSIISFMTIVCLFATMKPTFIKSPVLRLALFSTFGLCFGVPIVFLEVNYDPLYSLPPNLGPYTWGVGCYVFGAFLYITKIPERFFPGKLDLIGASH